MKKNIYITALHMMHGGVEMAISLMSNAFVKRGYNVTILSLYDLGEPAYELLPDVKIKYLTSVKPNRDEFKAAIRSKNPIRILKEGFYAVKVLSLKKSAIIQEFKNIKEGIIISTRNEHSVPLSKYGNAGVRKIAQLHHDHLFNKGLLNDFKTGYDNIDYFALLTDTLTQEVEELISGNNGHTKCLTIENFLDSVQKEPDLNKKEKTLVAVGRMHPVKGFDRMLEIWSKAVKDCPDWKLRLIGDGEELDSLKAKAKELRIAEKVEFTGALPHERVMEELENASVYLMTSHSEGFPFVLIEAMSCGLPVIAFDVRVGPRAIVKDGLNGILVEDGDQSAFAEAVCDLVRDTDKRISYSQNALSRAKDFSEEKIMEKWMKIIE